MTDYAQTKLRPTRDEEMRLLVANEPQAYRQAIAGTVGQLRPDVEVVVTSPSDDLESRVVCLVPDMVICSQLTPAIEGSLGAWVLLYPEGETKTVICIGGERTSSADLEFDELLAAIDRASALEAA